MRGMHALARHRGLFLVVIAAQLADLATFLPAIARIGIHGEQNPLARELFGVLGTAGPALLKLGALGVLLLVLWRIAARFPAYTGRSTALAVAFGLIGAWSNLAVAFAR